MEDHRVPPLPPYTYVPGRTPHPVSDPRGHSYGHTAAPVTNFDPQQPEQTPQWCEAVALFEAGYYWEAHEAWEQLWHFVGRTGPVGDCLKGLIKWAAAGVKAYEGRPEGVQRHCRRAAELLTPLATAPPITGLDLFMILNRIYATQFMSVPPIQPQTDVHPWPGWTLR